MRLPVSTPDLVVGRLRSDIVSGRLAPGEPLRQDEIARSFGVSHVPVREAFLRLQAERLVEIRPRRGAIVAALSAAELEELNEMRAALECCALRIAIPKLTVGDLQKAAQALDRIDHQPERWAELNMAFHTHLYAAAERPRQLATILSLQRSLERYVYYVYYQLKMTNAFADSQREHRKLLQLVERRKTDEACALMNDHILEPWDIVVSKLRESGHA
jgi:DNA-binding GntR family transcriptional regulator